MTALPVFAMAVPFQYIRIGDEDGFGYGNAAGLVGADGSSAERGGNPSILDDGDLLPDLNADGGTLTGSRDDFDNRSAGEVANTAGSAVGATNTGTTGSIYTDISLSTSYDASRAANDVYNAATGTRGAGGAFPSPPSGTLTNQPGFLFDFTVLKGDVNIAAPLYFNLVFGDFDVVPASVQFTRNDLSTFSLGLTVQPPNKDGLIQAAYTVLTFNDVFVDGGPAVWDGFLRVDFNAPNEPYTAFDYVEIGTTQIGVPTPDGGITLVLLGLGISGLAILRRKLT